MRRRAASRRFESGSFDRGCARRRAGESPPRARADRRARRRVARTNPRHASGRRPRGHRRARVRTDAGRRERDGSGGRRLRRDDGGLPARALCDDEGRAVGAAHAGWRGLAGGIVEKTGERVATLAGAPASALNAYLGPAIGPDAFEVGEDVLDAFVATSGAHRRDATAPRSRQPARPANTSRTFTRSRGCGSPISASTRRAFTVARTAR